MLPLSYFMHYIWSPVVYGRGVKNVRPQQEKKRRGDGNFCHLAIQSYQSSFTLVINLPHLFISLCRNSNLTSSLHSQIQNLRDNMSKITDEKNTLKKDLDTKSQELQERVRTITQVKKIGRRYKTQYDELKVEHDKVRAQELLLLFNPKEDGCIMFRCIGNTTIVVPI